MVLLVRDGYPGGEALTIAMERTAAEWDKEAFSTLPEHDVHFMPPGPRRLVGLDDEVFGIVI